MSFDTTPDMDDDIVISEINMTPLIDVMLVLLIIFIITIPVIHQAIQLNLPRASAAPSNINTPHIDIAVNNNGNIYWDNNALSQADFVTHIKVAAQKNPQPNIHLRADGKIPYENVAKVMATIQTNGLSKISLITQPQP